MPINPNSLGWRRDPPDPRDLRFNASLQILKELPDRAEVITNFPIYDQGPVGSCTGNALAAAVQYERGHDRQSPSFKPSPLFIYFNERVLERTVSSDAGAYLRDGVKTLAKLGVCHDTWWPDNFVPADQDGRFPPDARAGQRPTRRCYREALNHRVTSYRRVDQSLRQLQAVIAGGDPFVFGFSVFSGLVDAPVLPAVIPLPGPGESIVGGHAVLCIGYDNATQLFKIRNSWGDAVGDHGYFYMPYAYVIDHNLSADFWVIDTLRG